MIPELATLHKTNKTGSWELVILTLEFLSVTSGSIRSRIELIAHWRI